MEWCSGEWSEIHSCVKEELDSVIKDAQGTIGAYRARSDALRARDKLMHEKIAEARSAVRKNAYGMSPRTWKKLLETDWVTERSDVRDLGEGTWMAKEMKSCLTKWQTDRAAAAKTPFC